MRLFVAVWPPAGVIDRLSDLPRPERRGVRWTTPDQWHVTLRFLGSVADVDSAKAALARLEPGARAKTTTALAGPVVATLGRGVLCVPVAGLEDLAAAVVAATAEVGQPPESRPWKGHLTLARAKPGVDLRSLASLGSLAAPPWSASWPVEEVTLVASDTRPDGARYQVLVAYPLGGGRGACG